jgi:hypothetical protein
LLEGEVMLPIVGALLPLAVGVVVADWCWPRSQRLISRVVVVLSLGFGIAVGISSCSYFLWAVLFSPAHPGYVLAETLLLVLLLLVLVVARRRRAGCELRAPATVLPELRPRWRRRLYLIAGLVGAAALGSAIIWLVFSPHGDWDAWAIWNNHARFLYRGGDHWSDYLTNDLHWNHPDYPLLIPANVARLWTYAGGESTVPHRVLDLLFVLATVGLLGGSVATLRGRTQGLLAFVVLVSTPFFIENGTAQYADVPLGFFILATGVLLTTYDATGRTASLAMLAGATAGFAAWTKNEGSLFVVAVLLARLMVVIRDHGCRAWLKELFSFGVGALPGLLCLIYFKLRLAPANDLIAGQNRADTLERLLSLSRYGLIGGNFLRYLLLIGPGTVVVLALYSRLMRREPPASDRPHGSGNVLVVVLMLCGYILVFLTTPVELAVHLGVLERLFMHLWPLALFAFFVGIATPEELIAAGTIHYEEKMAEGSKTNGKN